MSNRKNTAGESGYSSPFALAVFAVAVCAALAMATVFVRTPAAATTNVSAESTAYFPAQYVNQATEIEPMPSTF